MNLRDELMALYRREGTLTAEIVVEEAESREESDPLHEYIFDLPAEGAARAHYLDRAAGLIRSVRRVVRLGEDEAPVGIREWHSVERRGGYVPLSEIVEDATLSELALRQAENEWRALFARYRHLERFLSLVRRDLVEVG